MDRKEKWYRRGEKNRICAIVQHERRRTSSYDQAAQNLLDNSEHYGLDRSIAAATITDLESSHRASFRKYLQKRFTRSEYGKSSHEDRLDLFLSEKGIDYPNRPSRDSWAAYFGTEEKEIFVSHPKNSDLSEISSDVYDLIRMLAVGNPSGEPADASRVRMVEKYLSLHLTTTRS